MAYKLGNQLALSIFVGEKELPVGGLMTVNVLHMTEALKLRLPLMMLDIVDTSGTMDSIPLLRDATSIRIVIEAGSGKSDTYSFRLFDWRREGVPGAVRWQFDGYADNPLWWAGTSTRTYYGSSTDVLEQIAQACRVPYKGVPSSDVRSWSQQGRRYGEFAQYVAARAYANDKSRLTMGYTLSNEIIVKDVNIPEEPVANISNKNFHEGYVYITDYQPETDSGFSNRSIGYESTMYRQSLVKPSKVEALDFTPNALTPQIDVGVRDIIQKGLPRHSPIDVGNSNQNTERALYQNIRYASLFSQRIHLRSDYLPIPVKLLDWVNLALLQDNNTSDVANSGMYLVNTRAILVLGTRYQEKVLCERHGVNVTG